MDQARFPQTKQTLHTLFIPAEDETMGQRLSHCSLYFAAMVFATACSVNSESNELKYRFSEKLFGSECTTGEQSFNNKTDYCAALKDPARNNYCAETARRETYLQECGTDFGGTPAVQPSPTPSPSQPLPAPTATATPVPNPTATPDPIDSTPPIVRELRTHGIELQIIENPIRRTCPSLPGGITFSEQLRRFWPTLEANKNEIIRRKDSVKTLTITCWASYSPARFELDLAAGFDSSGLLKYLSYVDREIALSKQTGINLEFSIDVYGHKPNDFTLVESRLNYFEGQIPLLTSLNSLVKTLILDSFLGFSLDDAKLRLNGDDFKTDFETASRALTPLVSFNSFAAKNGIRLSASFSSSAQVLEHAEEYRKTFEKLDSERESLATLIAQRKLKSIDFVYFDEIHFGRSGEMRIGLTDKARDLLTPGVRALAMVATRELELGIKVETSIYNDNVDEAYIECARRLDATTGAIKAKLAKVKGIRLEAGDESSFRNGYLTIGSEGSLADLETIIKSIK